jgi:hypothetical protein
MFGVAHEVAIALVKSSQPHLHTHTHTHTCSPYKFNILCANKCVSQASQYFFEHVLVKIVMICHKRKIRAQGRSRNIKEKCDMIEG